MADPVIHLKRQGSVGILTLNDPRNRNALSDAMREGLDRHVHEVATDDTIKALVITGTDGAFCAGGDIKAMIERHRTGGGGTGVSMARMRFLHRWVSVLSELPKPVICAVDGPAMGLGLGIALAADLVIASDRAVFSAAFSRIAVVPDGFIAYQLPRVVGLQRAKEMIYTARTVSAEQAMAYGIALEVQTPDATLPRAIEIADAMVNQSSLAFGMTKDMLNRSLENDAQSMAVMERQAQSICLNSDDHKAAIQRFVDKQPPAFSFPE